jgi:preprotein translocase subunit YajC
MKAIILITITVCAISFLVFFLYIIFYQIIMRVEKRKDAKKKEEVNRLLSVDGIDWDGIEYPNNINA